MLARRWRGATMAVVVGLVIGVLDAPAAAMSPQAAREDALSSVIDGYRARMPALMAQEHLPGLAVVVVDGDHVVWQEGFGVTDDNGDRITVDTMFSAQSTSKTFTATAVMLAVQAGLVDLDVPITTYLPDFTVHSAFEEHPERRITLRMLLGHTAGFTHEAPIGNNYGPEPGDFEAHVRSISATWLRFRVGTGYAYSNLGIDLAGRILEVVHHKPFGAIVRDELFAPLGMGHSTFDRSRVAAAHDRAVGHSGLVTPPVDSPMTAAGGLWTSARDLGSFLRFQLGNGAIGGREVLRAELMTQMRTVPAPSAGAPAGYALGVARTRWPVGHYLDLFEHGGGGNGFLTDLWWLPQLQLGIAVLTNSSEHDLQGTLALQILSDLVTPRESPYHQRMLALPTQSDVVEPDSHFVPPPDLARQIDAAAIHASPDANARWNRYPQLYRTGQPGSMNPSAPPSRFGVQGGAAFFDASEDGTPVRHSLTEFRPGLFLADNGETLDLRGPTPSWRGLRLNPVTGGPLGPQWVLLGVVACVAAGWLLIACSRPVPRLRRAGVSTATASHHSGRTGRRATTTIAAVGAVAALATVMGIRLVPGLVDVGFLGWMQFPVPIRLILHLPFAVSLLAASLTVLLASGASHRWWARPVRWPDAALALALAALAVQLGAWGMVQLAL